MEEATITLYKVRSCGFFGADDEHQFATLAETMRTMLRWTRTLDSIGESSTYSPDEDADILRAFCLDIRDLNGGRYLLATWNELATVEEGVQVLQVDSRIGAADISAVEIDALSLAGYPAFFCIDTRRGRLINIRFEQRLNGSRQLQRFIAGYLSSASKWCVWDADDEQVLIGYSDDDSADPEIAEGVVAKFETGLARVAAEANYITDHCLEIRKIIRRATIDPQIEMHRTFLDSAMQVAGMAVNNRLRADINFQYEFKMRLTQDKLRAVIEHHERHVDDSWDDVGFTFAGDSQKIYWLSGSVARSKMQLDVRRKAGGMIDLDSLAAYMGEHLIRILDSFNEQ